MQIISPFRRNVYVYLAVSFFLNLSFVTPVWVNFQRQFLTFTQMSLLTSASIAVMSLLQVPTGAFADFYGRRISMVAGALVWGAAMGLESLAVNGLMIVIGELAVGVGAAFISGANLAILFDSLKKTGRQEHFSKIRSVEVFLMQIAIMTSSVAAGYLFNLWIGLPYLLTGLAIAIGGIMSLLLVETGKTKSTFAWAAYYRQIRNGLNELAKDSLTRNLSLYYILVGGITWSWATYFNQIFATGLGYSVADKGWLFAIIRLVNVVILLRIFRAIRPTDKKKIYLLFPALILVVSGLAIIPNRAVGTTLLFLITLTTSLRIIVLDKYVNERFNSKYRATALSSLSMLVNFSALCLIALSGPVLDRAPAGLVYLGMGLISLALVLPLGVVLAKRINRAK